MVACSGDLAQYTARLAVTWGCHLPPLSCQTVQHGLGCVTPGAQFLLILTTGSENILIIITNSASLFHQHKAGKGYQKCN